MAPPARYCVPGERGAGGGLTGEGRWGPGVRDGLPGVAEGGTGAGGPEPRARGRGLCRGALSRGCRGGLAGAGAVSCPIGPVSSGHRARGVEAGSPVRHRALAAPASVLSLRRAAVQCGGGHGWQWHLHPARLHLLLAGRLPGEEERGQRGEHGHGKGRLSPKPGAEAAQPIPRWELGSSSACCEPGPA